MMSIPVKYMAAATLVAGLLAGRAAFAWSYDDSETDEDLVITAISVDFDTSTITITGKNFDFVDASDLKVTMASMGDITQYCLSPAPTSDTIVCDLTDPGLPSDGDYLVVVSTGTKKSQIDAYDLTIGAVGPKGDKGDPGPAGPKGDKGDQGDQGPPGISGLTTVSNSNDCTIPTSQNEVQFSLGCPVIVSCPDGKKVLGGGIDSTGPGFVGWSKPDTDSSWSCSARYVSSSAEYNVTVTCFAVCALVQ